MCNRTLTDKEKNEIIELIKKSGFESDVFFWEKRWKYFIVRSVLIYKPFGYHFLFEKLKNNKSAKEYFPNWAVEIKKNKESDTQNIGHQLSNWLNSINRTFIRGKKVSVPLEKGAQKRKNYEKYSRNISYKTDDH